MRKGFYKGFLKSKLLNLKYIGSTILADQNLQVTK